MALRGGDKDPRWRRRLSSGCTPALMVRTPDCSSAGAPSAGASVTSSPHCRQCAWHAGKIWPNLDWSATKRRLAKHMAIMLQTTAHSIGASEWPGALDAAARVVAGGLARSSRSAGHACGSRARCRAVRHRFRHACEPAPWGRRSHGRGKAVALAERMKHVRIFRPTSRLCRVVCIAMPRSPQR